jgi:hypothetical protein
MSCAARATRCSQRGRSGYAKSVDAVASDALTICCVLAR